MNQRIKNAILLAIICCLSFVTVNYILRQNRARAEAAKKLAGDGQLTISPAVNNAPLPACALVNKKGAKLSEEELRTGKVMLALVSPTCNFCLEDGDFLRERMAEHKDMRFYGVVTFGAESDLLTAESKFPFELYFDKGGELRSALGINGVPVKLYLENGVVKKVWMGSAVALHQEQAFDEWLRARS
jgi:hypothetical protein